MKVGWREQDERIVKERPTDQPADGLIREKVQPVNQRHVDLAASQRMQRRGTAFLDHADMQSRFVAAQPLHQRRRKTRIDVSNPATVS